MTTKAIEVSVKIGEKEVQKAGTVSVVETSADVLALLQSDEAGVLKNINYAMDLKARAAIRNAIMSENVDPNKATDKAFADFNKARVANGKTELTKEAFAALMAA